MSAQLNYIAPKFCCLLHPEIPHKSKWMPYHRYFSQYDAILTNKNVQLWLDLLEQKPEIICPPQKLKIGSRICDSCCERLHSHANDSRQNLSPKNQKLQQKDQIRTSAIHGSFLSAFGNFISRNSNTLKSLCFSRSFT